VTQANAQLRLAADQYRRTYGVDSLPPDAGFNVISLRDAKIGDIRTSLFVLLGAVGLVLLIAGRQRGKPAACKGHGEETRVRHARGSRRRDGDQIYSPTPGGEPGVVIERRIDGTPARVWRSAVAAQNQPRRYPAHWRKWLGRGSRFSTFSCSPWGFPSLQESLSVSYQRSLRRGPDLSMALNETGSRTGVACAAAGSAPCWWWWRWRSAWCW